MKKTVEEVSHELANDLQGIENPSAQIAALLLDAGFITGYQNASNKAAKMGYKHADFMLAALKMMGGLIGVQAAHGPTPLLALALMVTAFEANAEEAMKFTLEEMKKDGR